VATDDERVTYLAGDASTALDADERAALDDLRELLGDRSVWEEPDRGLEDRIVDAVSVEASTAARAPTSIRTNRRLRDRRLLLVAAAAAVLALVAGIGVALQGNSGGQPHYTAALAGTRPIGGSQGQASGNAVLTRTNPGWHIKLSVSGLPRLDNGLFYEGWLENRAGIIVPVGTFNGGPQVVLWAGVSPAKFPVFFVTRQMAGQLQPWEQVLKGTSHRS
jgi:hypothetical protein